MSPRLARVVRWLTLIGSGAFLLQAAPSCDLTLQFLQTGLLAGIAGGMYFLAKNV